MTYEIFISTRKVTHLVKNLGKNIKVLGEPSSGGTVPIQITVDSEFDILNLIHAGEEAGMELFTKKS